MIAFRKKKPRGLDERKTIGIMLLPQNRQDDKYIYKISMKIKYNMIQ